jgi:hypothetical protein
MSQSTGTVRKRLVTAREHTRSIAAATADVAPGSWTRSVLGTASFVGVLGLGTLTATRLLLNAPVSVPAVASGVWIDAATTAAFVGPAVALLLLGVTAADAWTRIGLSVAGAFGLLTAVTGAITVPAICATVVGGWATVLGTVGSSGSAARFPARVGTVAAVLCAGVTLSLLGALGVEPVALRSVGTTLTLGGSAATPLAVRSNVGAFAVGGGAAAATFSLAGTAPFVTGAVVLIAGGVVGGSTVLLAAAIGGATTTMTTGVVRRRVAPVAVGLLLLVAGVPSSLPRALGTVLAVAFVAATVHDGSAETV